MNYSTLQKTNPFKDTQQDSLTDKQTKRYIANSSKKKNQMRAFRKSVFLT